MSVTISKRVPEVPVELHRHDDLAIITIVFNPTEHRLNMNLDNVGQDSAHSLITLAAQWIANQLDNDTIQVGRPMELAAMGGR